MMNIKKLIVETDFGNKIHDYKNENQLTYKELYLVYTTYLSTIEYLAKKEGYYSVQ